MTKIRAAFLIAPLLLAIGALPAPAQRAEQPQQRQPQRYQQNQRTQQTQRRNNNFANGVRDGGHGGQYYDSRNYHGDPYYNQRNQGGIGPGKGALIGGAGGAVLGALFGGGLKGTIVGGAAGAGIGAIVGQAHQNSKSDDRNRR